MSHKFPDPDHRVPANPHTETLRDIEALFQQGPPEDWWAALGRQPLDALVRPAHEDDARVPVVAVAAAPEDLDALVALLETSPPER